MKSFASKLRKATVDRPIDVALFRERFVPLLLWWRIDEHSKNYRQKGLGCK
jgi:hypothetical protein